MKNKYIDKIIEKEGMVLEEVEATLAYVKLQERYLRRKVIVDKGFEQNLGNAQKQIRGLEGAIKDKNSFIKFLHEVKNEKEHIV